MMNFMTFFLGFGCFNLSSIKNSLCEALNIRFNEILRSFYYFLHVLLGKPHIMLCNVMCFISHEIKYSAPDKKNFFSGFHPIWQSFRSIFLVADACFGIFYRSKVFNECSKGILDYHSRGF